jgi:CheY-like chemotaxis protein/HPt (histidine-containing phosphotransfer) domain-containing protein
VVKDSGVGIKKEDFPKLFGTFQQLDRENNRDIVGTGLGLAITKNLVGMMDGEISFDSEYGVGSEFTVLIPLVEGNPAMVERKGLGSRIMAAPGAKVLVVDDNRINLKVALAFLATHSIRAETAEGGAEAIEKVQQQPYDLVFMDHMMPGIDGVEAAKRIRKLDTPWAQSMPIIALSANAVSGARETFLDAGMNDFISKPIDPGDLNKKLFQWLPAEKVSSVAEPGKKTDPPAASDTAHGGPMVLDRAAGLGNTGGDEVLYAQILASFHEDHYSDCASINKALAAGDYTQARRIAHTLKSTAGLIGAGPLGEAALAAETALVKEKEPPAEILRNLEKEFRELRVALDGSEFTNREVEDVNKGKGRGISEDRGEKALALIDTLMPLLQSGNTGSVALLGEIRECLPGYSDKGALLAKQIENFEFADALKTLMAIKTVDKGR